MYSRLVLEREYTLDMMLKKLGRPLPISYGDYTVIVDLEDGIYYVLEPIKDMILVYPVFYRVKKAGKWDNAIQQLLLTG